MKWIVSISSIFLFLHLQIHPWNFKINLNPASSQLSHATNRPDMGNHVMTKKMKRMESQNTLLIRGSGMEEETDDKIFVGCIQEKISWTESELSDSDFSINVLYVWMWELDYKESRALKGLESPLDIKEIHPVNPKGNWSWIFTGSTDAEAETSVL